MRYIFPQAGQLFSSEGKKPVNEQESIENSQILETEDKTLKIIQKKQDTDLGLSSKPI